MFEKYLALNPEVLKELKQDYNLYCMWRTEHSLIDPDIDPVHNPDWRASQCKKEQAQLQEDREIIQKFLEHVKQQGPYHDGSANLE